MKVKEIIKQALLLVSRGDVVNHLGKNTGDEEQKQTIQAMLLCYNSVEDELARTYLPLIDTQSFTPQNGKIAFSTFAHVPVKLFAVTENGHKLNYRVQPDGVLVEGSNVQIRYGYAPPTKELEDDCSYGDLVGAVQLSYGTASEYCVVSGRGNDASNFEARYHECVAQLQALLQVPTTQTEHSTGVMPAKPLPHGGYVAGMGRAFV